MSKAPDPFQKTKHGTHLACRATGDVEEGEQFIGRPALESLGDVVGHGYGGAFNLISQAVLFLKRRGFCERIDQFRQPDGFLPHGQIFKAFVGHNGFQISNPRFQTGTSIAQLFIAAGLC